MKHEGLKLKIYLMFSLGDLDFDFCADGMMTTDALLFIYFTTFVSFYCLSLAKSIRRQWFLR